MLCILERIKLKQLDYKTHFHQNIFTYIIHDEAEHVRQLWSMDTK